MQAAIVRVSFRPARRCRRAEDCESRAVPLELTYFVDHFSRAFERDRGDANRNALEKLGRDTAHAEQNDRSDLRIAPEAYDHFGETALHLLHQNAFDARGGK